jgi:hypothetical protein
MGGLRAAGSGVVGFHRPGSRGQEPLVQHVLGIQVVEGTEVSSELDDVR